MRGPGPVTPWRGRTLVAAALRLYEHGIAGGTSAATRQPTMSRASFRVVVASTLVLQLLYGLGAFIAPLVLSCRHPALAPHGGRELLLHAIDGATMALFVAWCLRTALRWLPTHSSHAITLALGVGTLFVGRGMIGLAVTPFAAFDVVTGVALVAVSGALWRARARVIA